MGQAYRAWFITISVFPSRDRRCRTSSGVTFCGSWSDRDCDIVTVAGVNPAPAFVYFIVNSREIFCQRDEKSIVLSQLTEAAKTGVPAKDSPPAKTLAKEVFPTPRSPNKIACCPFWPIALNTSNSCAIRPGKQCFLIDWGTGAKRICQNIQTFQVHIFLLLHSHFANYIINSSTNRYFENQNTKTHQLKYKLTNIPT